MTKRHISNIAGKLVYSQGFACRLTGDVEELYGGIFYRAEALEGPREGEELDLGEAEVSVQLEGGES